MERIIRLLIILFLIASFSGNAQEKLQLKLHEGQQIRFSYIRSSSFKEFDLVNTTTEEQWDTDLRIIRETDENQFIIELRPARYRYNKRQNLLHPDIHFDSDFVPLTREGETLQPPYLSSYLLCSLPVQMQLDLQSAKLRFLDSENLNTEIDRILQSGTVDPEDAKNIKKEMLDDIKEIGQFTREYLLHFHHAAFDKKDVAEVTGKDYMVARSGNIVRLNRKQSVVQEGRTEEQTQKALINANNGLVTEYVSSIYQPGYARKNGRYVSPKSEKKIYCLTSDSDVQPGQTVISGYIEHPVGPRVHIQFTDDPAGTRLKTITAVLDSAGRFSVSLPLKHEGFIFILNTYNENQVWNDHAGIIYVEPGDRISFEVSGVSPRKLIPKGDRAAENRFVQDNMPGIKFTGAVNFRNKKEVFQYSVPLLPLMKNDYPLVHDLTDLDDFIQGNQLNEKLDSSMLSLRFKTFFSNEVAMAKLNLASFIQLNILGFLEENRQDEKTKNAWINLKLFTDTFQINRHYNEYGYFSRKAVREYAGFLYHTTKKVTTNGLMSSSPVINGPYHTVLTENFYNFPDLVLAGSALIRAKADIFTDMLNTPTSSSMEAETRLTALGKVFHELIRCSKDSLLNNYLTEKYNHALDLMNGSVFSRKILLNEQGDSVSIRDFTGGKLVIIGMATDWATSRIDFDQIAEKHPEATFAFLVNGSHFETWKDYLSRAHAKAIQLFLPSGDYSLKELFGIAGRQTHFLVFDIKGSLSGQTTDTKQLEGLLQQARNPSPVKNEPDKTLLLGIIWSLGGLTLLFAVAFLVSRYRVRRKMKKQEQEKRLRELELTAIRSQMNPHFLFNSLNSVQNLIRQNRSEEANLYLSDFAGIIRKVMRNSEKEEISLAEELELVDQYLRVEKLRFDFEYAIQVEEQVDAPHLMIPPLLIQPFAENALLHGLQHKPAGRRLQISISKEGPQIRILIEDNGIGREAAEKQETETNGKGIKMNTERLKILEEKYGGTYSIRITDLTTEGESGTRVEISLPDEE